MRWRDHPLRLTLYVQTPLNLAHALRGDRQALLAAAGPSVERLRSQPARGPMAQRVRFECFTLARALRCAGCATEALELLASLTRPEDPLERPLIEAHVAGGSRRVAQEHEEHRAWLDALAHEASSVAAAVLPQRQGLALRLYRHMALFMAEHLQHMQVEEALHNQALLATCSDEEIDAMHQAMLASIESLAKLNATDVAGLHAFLRAVPPRAAVVVEVNATNNLFNGPPLVHDDTLQAWAAPEAPRQVQGWPLHHGWQFVWSKAGRVPWVPVSQAEFLDFAARELERQRTNQGESAWLQQQREARARHRSAMGAAALAAQARAVWTWQHPDVPAERWPRLVKLDPDFPWDSSPQRAQFIRLATQGNDAQAAAMERALHSIDLAGFEASCQRR